ncbi:phosphocholine cytidylyltransferase family protein [Elongatibacter sediminis]|uniref:Phosphocholine cytidylyltransferase family protein n=1 Tax=Elongatibacter sediminis TaxID=3119006 RepID=A0AAW9R5V5_9GAMM
MKAIILCAGQGRRLLPLTESIPKCCLQLGDRTMLQVQVDALCRAGIDEIVVVTGFGHHVVDDIIGRIDSPVPLRTLYNPFYALSDNLGTCWVARAEMTGSFLLLNGDTLFEPAVMRRLIDGAGSFPVTLAADRKAAYDDDDMKIHADGDRLLQVGKKLPSAIVNGESIGMMVFTGAGGKAFVRRVEQLMGGPDGLARWYLSAIDDLARDGLVGIASIHGLGWCEVDDMDDLAHAEHAVRIWSGRADESAGDLAGTEPPPPAEN